MSISHSLARCLSAAAVTCSTLIVAAPSQAAVVGSFDPAFDNAAANLGYRGTITLEVSSQCYAAGPGVVFNNSGGCVITPDGAQINFYDTRDPSKTTLQTVNLLMGDFPGMYYVNDAVFAGGQLISLDTNNSYVFDVPAVTDALSPPLSYAEGNMFLYFTSGLNLVSSFAVSNSALPAAAGAYLVNCPNFDSEEGCYRDPANTSDRAVTTFVSNVPEPDSVALTVLGLGLLVASRRRRKASAGRPLQP